MAEFTLIHPLYRGIDPLYLDAASAFGFQLHGLGLQGIHPGQPPDHGLVKFNRLTRFLGDFGKLLDFPAHLQKTLFKRLDVYFPFFGHS